MSLSPPSHVTSPIAPELVGREVSVRALVPLWQAARAKGFDPERLAKGVGYGVEHLTDVRERISWAAFLRFLSNLGGLFDDQALIAIGAAALATPGFRAMLLPGRLLFGVPDVYRWAFGPTGPPTHLFACHEGTIRQIAPGRLRLEMRMRPGYPPSRQNYLLLLGSLRALSQALGAGPAEVTQESIEGGEAFDIRVPEVRGMIGYVRGIFGWVFAARSAGDELRRAHEELHQRYVELQREIEARARVEVERQRLEEQLRHAQKMDAVGRLAGGIAHDFNNVLSVILSYTALLIRDLDPGDPKAEDLDQIQKAGQRAASLTRQLLAFSRQQMIEARVLDLNDLVGEMDPMIRRLIGEDVDWKTVQHPSLWKIKADPGHIEQVLMNLVVNARDAMPKGGKLTIETSNVELDLAYAKDHLGVAPGRYVLLTVKDDGIGMDTATQARIFEPFFTTKDKSKGTGLGLSTVFGIVKQSGGSIWVESEPGRGATFKIYLPKTEQTDEPAVRRMAVRSLRGTETILVVDDESPIRTVTRGVLERSGYRVLDAANLMQALGACEVHSGSIDLLLTDVVMPETSGRELADRVTSLYPRIKVIFMSGYTEDAVVRHGVLEAELVLLQKPITPDALLRKVREVLDRS